jgi:hypothetical protein
MRRWSFDIAVVVYKPIAGKGDHLKQRTIFRPVDRHGRVHEGRLSGEGVALVLRERVAAAGLRLL